MRAKLDVLREHEFEEQMCFQNKKVEPRPRWKLGSQEILELTLKITEASQAFAWGDVVAFPNTIGPARKKPLGFRQRRSTATDSNESYTHLPILFIRSALSRSRPP